MPAADSNVLVRLLTNDSLAQTDAVRRLLDRLERERGLLYIPLTAVLELEWVLRALYDFAKVQVLEALSELLETRELDFENEAVLEQALALYRAHNIDFGECLHLANALQAARVPFLTFDKAASKLPGAARLA